MASHQGHPLNWARIAIVVTGAGILLGAVGFAQVDPSRGWSSNLYLAVQLVTLNSGAIEPVPWTLEAGRWLAPIGTVVALLTAFASQVGRFVANRWLRILLRAQAPRHYLVFGAGADGQHVVRTLAAGGGIHARPTVVLLDREVPEDLRRDLQREGIFAVEIEAFTPEALGWLRPGGAEHLFAAMPTDDENLSLAMALAMTHRITEDGRPRVSALLWDDRRAGILEDDRLWLPPSPIRQVRVVNRPRTLARRLLLELPLETLKTAEGAGRLAGSVHLVLGAGDRWSEAILRHAVTQAWYPWCPRLQVHLVGPDAKDRQARLLGAFPGLPSCTELHLHPCSEAEWVDRVSTLVREGPPDAAWTVLPGFEDNLHAHLQGLRLASVTREASGGRVRIVVGQQGEDLLAGPWQEDSEVARHVHVEPLDDWTTDARMQFGERLDRLARHLHEQWYAQRVAEVRARATEDPEAAVRALHALPTARPWPELAEETRGFNRSVADHVWVKLRSVALHTGNAALHEATDILCRDWLLGDRGRSTPGATATADALACIERAWAGLDPALLEELARCEHDRWCADRWIAGWQYAPVRDDQRRRHSDLVPYDELPQSTRDRDREQVRRVPSSLRAVIEAHTSP